MSKKDYITFARMINKQRRQILQDRREHPDASAVDNGADKQVNMIVDELCIIFRNDNPNFNSEKFVLACEIDNTL